jgi:hypothetical protein
MNNHRIELEIIASNFLKNADEKPRFLRRDFDNCTIIFMRALMDKLVDKMIMDGIDIDEGGELATQCGTELRDFIIKYTGIDMHNIGKLQGKL